MAGADPVRRPHIVNCRNAVCTGGGGIKLVVGEGKGMELFAVSVGDLVAGPCVCGKSGAARELETEMPSEAYELEGEAVGEAQASWPAKRGYATEYETEGELAGETGYEAENETDFETEAAAEMATETAAEAETEAVAEVETEGWTLQAESFESDPYAPIRSAMAPEHANLAAEEVSLILGGAPARVVLHQLLDSPARATGGAREPARQRGAPVGAYPWIRHFRPRISASHVALCAGRWRRSMTPRSKARSRLLPALPAAFRSTRTIRHERPSTPFSNRPFRVSLEGPGSNPRRRQRWRRPSPTPRCWCRKVTRGKSTVRWTRASDPDSKDQLARALNLSGPWGRRLQRCAAGDRRSRYQVAATTRDGCGRYCGPGGARLRPPRQRSLEYLHELQAALAPG